MTDATEGKNSAIKWIAKRGLKTTQGVLASKAAQILDSIAARGQIWILPQHVLIELILGLNSLIASSQLVLRHEFSRAKN